MLSLFMTYLDSDADKALLEDMFYAYRKQMLMLAASIVKNNSDAEDVVHNVFLNIAQKSWDTVSAIEDERDLRNYLLKATKNTSLNTIKANKRGNISLDNVIQFNLSEATVPDEIFIDTICDKIGYGEIVEAIKSLNEIHRNVLYYHFVAEIPVPQVAKLLGQTVSATRKQLVKGKKALLNLLKGKGAEYYVNEQR